MRLRRTAYRDQRGTSLVEFALIAPLLLLLLIGIVDVARIVNAYVTVSHASREGAHWASLHPISTPTEVVQKAIAPRVIPLNPTTPVPMAVQVEYYDAVTATFKPFSASAGNPGVPKSSPGPKPVPVRVSVDYQISTVTFFVGSLLGQFGVGQTLSTSSTTETIR